MKYREFTKTIDALTQNELKLRTSELRRKIAQTRLSTKVGRTKNFREVFSLRKQLAVILTRASQKV